VILGCEKPRIWTPERRELSPETTHGFACIAFAEEILEIKLFPWQKWLLIHGLELDENGLYLFRTVVVEVARQSGKSLLMVVLALWHIYALDSRMVIATAQDLSRAEESWESAVEWAMDNDELEPLIAGTGDRDRAGVKRGHPKRLILDTGCEYRVASSSKAGGKGFSGNLILMDELQEHQTWDSWAAVTKTTMARPKAQVWAFANAGTLQSVVLRRLRAKAHRDLDWPDGDADKEVLDEPDEAIAALLNAVGDVASGFYEWSAPPTSARTDMKALAQANPSMNHTDIVPDCVTERSLIHALAEDPAAVFDKECRCIWVASSDGGPFPAESWSDTSDTAARVGSEPVSSVCVEIDAKRSRSYIARATLDMGGKPVAGIWKDQAGTDWVVPFLLENRERFSVVVIRIGGGVPVASLANEVDTAALPYEKWNSAEVAAGFGQVFDLLRDRNMRHLPHPALDAAATSAATKVHADGGQVVDANKSPTDTSPLTALIGAVWGLNHIEQEPPKPRVHGWDEDKIARWRREAEEMARP
jgi:hypothetical protein